MTIRGQGADRYYPPPRRSQAGTRSQSGARSSSRERFGRKRAPERAAMWAVLLGVLLVLAAAASSHAATRSVAHRGSPAAKLAPAAVRIQTRVISR